MTRKQFIAKAEAAYTITYITYEYQAGRLIEKEHTAINTWDYAKSLANKAMIIRLTML